MNNFNQLPIGFTLAAQLILHRMQTGDYAEEVMEKQNHKKVFRLVKT